MGLTSQQLASLPASTRRQIEREKSRELGRGNETVPQPRDTSGVWYQAARCSLTIRPVPALQFLPATATLPNRLLSENEWGSGVWLTWESDSSVRYFADRSDARTWVTHTYVAEIKRLEADFATFLAQPERPTGEMPD